ncbi:hypothetical protein [Bosea sp. LjRoot237]|uniref:hypothetical protein n=1 Tax=Bosea sp. LjRoot237 TaxID=3342292 RepID=UPI003ECCF522
MRIVSLLALAFSLLALPAVAQDKPVPAPQPEPMRIVLTRSAEPCEPDCREWLAAQGAISNETLAELRRALAELNGRKLPLLVYSTGGTVEAAIAMGELVRKSGLDIAVARTVFTQRDPALGTIDERSPLCASACTLFLAGGQRRIIPPQSRIGVHQQTIVETETTTVRDYKIVRGRRELVDERTETRTVKQEQATGEIDAKMRRYLNAMGLDRSFLETTVSTPADTMRYLKPDEMLATTIATELGSAALAFSSLRTGLPPGRSAGLSAAAPVIPATLVAPATPIGSVELGPHRGGKLRLALSIGEGRYQQTTVLQMRLLFGDAPIPTRLRTVTLTFPNGPPIVARNDDGSDPDAPMTVDVLRETLCGLTDRTSMSLKIEPPAEDGVPSTWQRSGTAAELLRLPALRTAVCR